MARQLRVHDAHEKTGLITDKCVVDAAGVRCHGNNTLCLFPNKNFKLEVLFLHNSRTVRVYLGISPPTKIFSLYEKALGGRRMILCYWQNCVKKDQNQNTFLIPGEIIFCYFLIYD